MGSKSATKAKSTKTKASSNGGGKVGTPHQKCPLTQHFFKLKVEDTNGKAITSIRPAIELNNGAVIAAAPLTNTGSYDSGPILTEATACKVSFPTLYDAEWWPEGPPPSGFTVDQQITIADGDCVSKVTKDQGFQAYKTIWSQSKNDVLKGQHPNPNSLVVGDILWAPDQKTKSVSKAVDQEWKFVIATDGLCTLNLILIDKEEKPLSGWDWELAVPDITRKGKTGADGVIRLRTLDPAHLNGTLKVQLKKPAAPTVVDPPVSPTPNPPPYPAPIIAAHYKDKVPPKPPDSDIIDFTLKIGSLPSHKVTAGLLGRLRNLGYNCNVDSDAEKTTAVVKTYQKVVLKKPAQTSVAADILQDVEEHHSKA